MIKAQEREKEIEKLRKSSAAGFPSLMYYTNIYTMCFSQPNPSIITPYFVLFQHQQGKLSCAVQCFECIRLHGGCLSSAHWLHLSLREERGTAPPWLLQSVGLRRNFLSYIYAAYISTRDEGTSLNLREKLTNVPRGR